MFLHKKEQYIYSSPPQSTSTTLHQSKKFLHFFLLFGHLCFPGSESTDPIESGSNPGRNNGLKGTGREGCRNLIKKSMVDNNHVKKEQFFLLFTGKQI